MLLFYSLKFPGIFYPKKRDLDDKVLLYNTGNYIQYSVINHNGKYEKECIYMYN